MPARKRARVKTNIPRHTKGGGLARDRKRGKRAAVVPDMPSHTPGGRPGKKRARATTKTAPAAASKSSQTQSTATELLPRTVTLQLPPKLVERIETLCHDEDYTFSDVTTIALYEWLLS